MKGGGCVDGEQQGRPRRPPPKTKVITIACHHMSYGIILKNPEARIWTVLLRAFLPDSREWDAVLTSRNTFHPHLTLLSWSTSSYFTMYSVRTDMLKYHAYLVIQRKDYIMYAITIKSGHITTAMLQAALSSRMMSPSNGISVC